MSHILGRTAVDAQIQSVFPYLFPLFFLAMWLAVTALLGAMSGWFELQRRFPDTREPAYLTLRMRSGRMRFGVHMSGILTLSACPSGLRVGVWRLFGPFQRAFLVPWDEIEARPRTLLLWPSMRLCFGRPEAGRLTIDARLWQRLAAEAPAPGMLSETTHVSLGQVGRRFLLIWAAGTAAAAIFFYQASRAGNGMPLPLSACIGFPAFAFGLPLLIRFARQL